MKFSRFDKVDYFNYVELVIEYVSIPAAFTSCFAILPTFYIWGYGCLFRDFHVRTLSRHLNFAILRKFYILNHFKFAFLSVTIYIS